MYVISIFYHSDCSVRYATISKSIRPHFTQDVSSATKFETIQDAENAWKYYKDQLSANIFSDNIDIQISEFKLEHRKRLN